MKNIKKFKDYKINESVDYKKLPESSYDSDIDEEIFFFSTENKEKSLVLDLIFDMVNISVESGKKLKGLNPQATDLWVTYKPGYKNVYYNYDFWTEDESIIKKSSNHFKGHEWRMEVDVPVDIIEKLYNNDIKIDIARERIKSESEWRLIDGMILQDFQYQQPDPQGDMHGKEGGWQMVYIVSKFKQDLETKRKKSNPGWIQKIKNFFN